LHGLRFIRAGTGSSAKSARQQDHSEDCFHRKKNNCGFRSGSPSLTSAPGSRQPLKG
jgi:hypothetical protein